MSKVHFNFQQNIIDLALRSHLHATLTLKTNTLQILINSWSVLIRAVQCRLPLVYELVSFHLHFKNRHLEDVLCISTQSYNCVEDEDWQGHRIRYATDRLARIVHLHHRMTIGFVCDRRWKARSSQLQNDNCVEDGDWRGHKNWMPKIV